MSNENKEKQFDATQRKLRKAVREGQVGKSQEFSSIVSFLAGIILIAAAGPSVIGGLADFLSMVLERIPEKAAGAEWMLPVVWLILAASLLSFFVAIVGMLAIYIQIGPVFSIQAVSPKLERLNPVNKLQQLFSMATLKSLLNSVLKTLLILLFGYWTIRTVIRMGPLVIRGEIFSAWEWFIGELLKLTFTVLALTIPLGVWDFFIRKKEWKDNLRMDQSELKQERKEQSQSQEVKSAIADQRRSLSENRTKRILGSAKVVVANPTHIAIPLIEFEGYWFIGGMEVDETALEVIDLAEHWGIPVMRDVEIARAIYSQGEVLKPIPRELSEYLKVIIDWLEGKGAPG